MLKRRMISRIGKRKGNWMDGGRSRNGSPGRSLTGEIEDLSGLEAKICRRGKG
jgi:hypothetical protein